MENQHTAESLKEMIAELEERQAEEGMLLKEQLDVTINNLRPANILQSIVKEFHVSQNLLDELVNTAISITSGFVSKKIVVGRSKNQFLKLIGLAVQFGITTVISKKFHILKEKVNHLIERFLSEKEKEEKLESEENGENEDVQ